MERDRERDLVNQSLSMAPAQSVAAAAAAHAQELSRLHKEVAESHLKTAQITQELADKNNRVKSNGDLSR